MKVICVDTNALGFTPSPNTPKVTEGNVYTVMQVTKPRQFGFWGPLVDMDFYVLSETGPRNMYLAEMFAPLDGPDETEIAEARAEREGIRLDCELVSLIERIEYA